VELIEFGRLGRAGGRRGLVRQGVGMDGYPVGDSLMNDTQGLTDAAQVHAIDIGLDSPAAEILAVALRPPLTRLRAAAGPAQVVVTARRPPKCARS
jgi:hypothetical protein